jgi:hypothetical protein
MSVGKNNPANSSNELPKDFRPMNSTSLRLEVPERDGYHRHWFRGNAERIARAQQAGYRFVDPEDVGNSIYNIDLAGDSKSGGSTDLGTRVSVISGDDVDRDGQPGRLYLMEVPNDLYEVSKRMLEERNDSVAEALRGGMVGSEHDANRKDTHSRYLTNSTNTSDLFIPKRRP